MHEQSETIQDSSGRWINVYGREPAKGLTLPLEPGVSYATEPEASAAARVRSQVMPPEAAPSKMKTWEVEVGGKTYEVEAPTLEAASKAAQQFGQPKAEAPKLSQADREAYLLGTGPEGQKTQEAILKKYGMTRHQMGQQLDPTAEFLGEHVSAAAPYALTAAIPGVGVPWTAARLGAGALIGAFPELNLLQHGAVSGIDRGIGAVKGAASQLAGEVAPLAVAGVQRLTGRAYNRLSKELADRLMADAKKLVPAWKDLPDGVAGLRALVEGGGDKALTRLRELATKEVGAGDPQNFFAKWDFFSKRSGDELAGTLEQWNAGRALLQGLRAMKIIDSKTGKLDAESLAQGMSRVMTGTAKSEKYGRVLGKTPEVAETIKTASEASRTAKGAAPETGTLRMPFFRISGHHMGAGEGLPLIPYSRNVRPSAAEQTARDLATTARGVIPPLAGDLGEAVVPTTFMRSKKKAD